jgi:hypothetical protein
MTENHLFSLSHPQVARYPDTGTSPHHKLHRSAAGVSVAEIIAAPDCNGLQPATDVIREPKKIFYWQMALITSLTSAATQSLHGWRAPPTGKSRNKLAGFSLQKRHSASTCESRVRNNSKQLYTGTLDIATQQKISSGEKLAVILSGLRVGKSPPATCPRETVANSSTL